MYYCVKNGVEEPLVLATCDSIETEETAFAIAHNASWHDYETAVRLNAMVRDKLGILYPLGGIPITVKIEDCALFAWWAGKWRPICYYNPRRKWNEEWVKKEVLRVFRVNVPFSEDVTINIKRKEN